MSSLRARKSSRIEVVDLASEAKPKAAPRQHLPRATIGRLVGFDAEGSPLVDFPGCPAPRPIAALSTSACGEECIGRDVALVFVDGNPARPLVIGLIHRSQPTAADAETPPVRPPETLEGRLDGERVVLKADREIVLECGKASITLTRAGKVLIRGAYLLSRSSGVNRIKGGSVQIN